MYLFCQDSTAQLKQEGNLKPLWVGVWLLSSILSTLWELELKSQQVEYLQSIVTLLPLTIAAIEESLVIFC